MENILVVDDEDELRTTLVEVLTREGLAVQEAANADQALTMLQCTPFHLILLHIPADDGEVDVYFRKYFGILLCPARGNISPTIGNVLPPFAQDGHHVIAGACPHAEQQGLHGARTQIPAATFRRAIHDHFVPGRRFTDEGRAAGPGYARLHRVPQLVQLLPGEYHTGRISCVKRSAQAAWGPGKIVMVDNGTRRPESVIDRFLGHCQIRSFPAKHILIREGDPTNDL